MTRIGGVCCKVGFRPMLLKSYKRRFAAIAGIGFGLLAGSLQAESVYVAGSSGISAFNIGQNGAVLPIPGSPFAGSGLLAVDLLGRFIYVTNSGGSISAYRIRENGALTPAATSPFPAGPMAVDLLGRFAYVSGGNNAVSAYRIGENGVLTPVGGPVSTAGINPSAVVVDTLGRSVYITNESSNNVSAYHIALNGALTPVLGSPFDAGSGPVAIAVDIWGRNVYVTNVLSSNISAYRIAQNGGLTAVAGSPFLADRVSPTGASPRSVAVDLFGRFVYVACEVTNHICAYSIGENGALTPGAVSPGGFQPVSVAVDLLGRYVYVADFFPMNIPANNFTAYRIGPKGALTFVPGSSFQAGLEARSVLVGP
jgi:6-phosphogluconolactonase